MQCKILELPGKEPAATSLLRSRSNGETSEKEHEVRAILEAYVNALLTV